MADYIELEALLSIVKPDDPSDEKDAITIATAKKLIRSLVYRVPSADVAPVRHGKWNVEWDAERDQKRLFVRIVCSNCGLKTGQKSNYCPNCGANMRGINYE